MTCNTMQYHAIPYNTMQYYAIPCNAMQYSGILWHTLAYPGILWHTLACSGIFWHYQCIINNCWRSVPLPSGQYNGHFSHIHALIQALTFHVVMIVVTTVDWQATSHPKKKDFYDKIFYGLQFYFKKSFPVIPLILERSIIDVKWSRNWWFHTRLFSIHIAATNPCCTVVNVLRNLLLLISISQY